MARCKKIMASGELCPSNIMPSDGEYCLFHSHKKFKNIGQGKTILTKKQKLKILSNKIKEIMGDKTLPKLEASREIKDLMRLMRDVQNEGETEPEKVRTGKWWRDAADENIK